ncbi:redoxin domain-containing protein [Planoprotostelium fungivorum]|uniref:Redoxin domain-containing protein n=1 Tax=Planoprotostelium fungivorum TaxID=1890364 RepID=A0A2P6MXR9_9EUKA|nr:redoxin domain-containing protein [Planoprotostelium fungivorum]
MGVKFVKGQHVDFSDLMSKKQSVFVFEFWATWCGPCRQTVGHLTQLQKQYESQNVIFVGISDEDETTVKRFVDQMGSKMDYRVAIDRNRKMNENYMQSFNVRGIPHAFIVDKEGKIAWHGHPGEGSFGVEIQKAVNARAKPSIDHKSMSEEQQNVLSVSDIKSILKYHHVDFSGAVEKQDLLDLLRSKC